MAWIAFAYSLSKQQSSARVALWRRLQRLGAVAPAGNVYILPAVDDCVESFQWLTQEIQEAGGQAVMFHCDEIEGITEEALIGLFWETCAKDYQEILDEIMALETELSADEDNLPTLQNTLAKLRRQYADIQRIDYFASPQGIQTENRLNQLEQKLAGDSVMLTDIPSLQTANYQGKIWVTRPQPFIDRLASIWLIRRFIDEQAIIRYSHQVSDNEISFDMPNAQFSHVGNLCTFETLITSFQLVANGLAKLAEIVHEIDLHDGIYNHPETVGIELVLKGWLKQGLRDEELEDRGLALFDGLYSEINNR